MTTTLAKLKRATSLHSVARLLGFKPSALSYILYIKDQDKKYYKFDIPKRSGGTRTILSPNPDLKCLQKRLSILLQDCIDEINKNKNIKGSISHGFKRGYSVITNAEPHRKRRYVFNIDLEDFFGCINFGRVRGFFIKNNNFNLNEKVATVLAQIICHDNALPQGSPCSPVVSNLIAHILDIQLASLAHKYNCSYSRYADDITFSSNKPFFPDQIAKHNENTLWSHGESLERAITKHGFTINSKKTRMQYRDSRQSVTGLTVNRKTNSRLEYRRTAKAMVHSLFTTGKFYIKTHSKTESGTASFSEKEGNLNQLNGILGFIDLIDISNKNKNNKIELRELSSRENIYRNFLLYKNFYKTEKLKIICEGKTDNIYIREAIKSLSDNYPDLIDNKDKKIKVGFFNYTKINNRLCFLSGGTSDLQKFIFDYPKACENFTTKIGEHPVVIIIDNDMGCKPIYSSIKQKTKENIVDGNQPFYYLGNNLYLIVIPKINNKDTMIEDYFAKEVLETKLREKTFSKSNNFNPKTQYGKHVFANEIIKKHGRKIDFSMFSLILEKIILVKRDYEIRLKP